MTEDKELVSLDYMCFVRNISFQNQPKIELNLEKSYLLKYGKMQVYTAKK